MTDRELLELAAKAAGIELTWDCTDRVGEPWTVIKGVVCAYWNPLSDDGNALRLAVKLNLVVLSDQTGISTANGMHQRAKELHGTDPLAATRRAITRAAAEIGRSTK